MRPAVLAAVAFLGLAPMASGQPAGLSSETIEVPSATLSDSEFLGGVPAAPEAVTLSGILAVPAGEGPVPAIILLHGSGGAGAANMARWAQVLGELGVASLRLDSYGGRGLTEIFSGQGRLGEFAVVYDAYRAAELLADDPRIDPARIGVMGFSRGGIGALYSSLARFDADWGPEGLTLAAHVPFYPPCNFALADDTETTGAPILAVHGTPDNWNPAEPCRNYVARLAAAGADARWAEFEGGQHSFDNPGSPAYFIVSNAQTSRRCFRREVDGVLHNEATGAPFAWTDDCVETGPAQQFHREAAAGAQAAVSAFLVEVFGLEN